MRVVKALKRVCRKEAANKNNNYPLRSILRCSTPTDEPCKFLTSDGAVNKNISYFYNKTK